MDSGLDPGQLLTYVVRPVLSRLALPGGSTAEMLVMGTAAQESGGFRYIHQLGKGPALSLWQIEPSTATDAVERCSEAVQNALHDLGLPSSSSESWEEWEKILPGNLYLSAAMCRLVYYLKPFKLQEDKDATINKLARIWKLYYNTPQGAGTEAQFVANWHKYLGSVYQIEEG